MKKEHILLPEPNSKFLKVNCKECEKENIVSEPTGSKAKINGKISGTA